MITTIRDASRIPDIPLKLVNVNYRKAKLTGSRMIEAQMYPWKANSIFNATEIESYRFEDEAGEMYEITKTVLLHYLWRNPNNKLEGVVARGNDILCM